MRARAHGAGARTQASKHVWASSHSQAQAACYRLARQFYPTNITLNPSPARCADCPRPAPPPPQKRQGGSSQPAASRCRGPPIPRSVARCCRCWLQDTTPALDQPCMCCHAHCASAPIIKALAPRPNPLPTPFDQGPPELACYVAHCLAHSTTMHPSQHWSPPLARTSPPLCPLPLLFALTPIAKGHPRPCAMPPPQPFPASPPGLPLLHQIAPAQPSPAHAASRACALARMLCTLISLSPRLGRLASAD